MLSWRHVWSAALLCAVLALLGAPAALAQSAGNQQYVDPLASTTPSTPASSSAPAPTPSPSSTPSAPASSSSAGDTSTQTTSSASGAPAASSSRTLPFTGLDLWPAVAVGFGLIGSGLAIRRVVRRT